MRPNKMQQQLTERSVNRNGLSPASYEELEDAETVEDIKQIFLDIFEPSAQGSE